MFKQGRNKLKFNRVGARERRGVSVADKEHYDLCCAVLCCEFYAALQHVVTLTSNNNTKHDRQFISLDLFCLQSASLRATSNSDGHLAVR